MNPAASMSDQDLDKELAFAVGFGPDIDPAAPAWTRELAAEQDRRDTNRETR